MVISLSIKNEAFKKSTSVAVVVQKICVSYLLVVQYHDASRKIVPMVCGVSLSSCEENTKEAYRISLSPRLVQGASVGMFEIGDVCGDLFADAILGTCRISDVCFGHREHVCAFY